MLINVLRDEQPSHVAVAFDRSEPTFRHEQYVEYKANRRETPEDFRSQLSLIFEVLDALGIARLSAPGYEADDVIATLATRAENEGMDVLIVTGDRDVLQLVDDHVTALLTRRGITEMSRFTPAAVEEKYGLTPQQYPDFAAIRGDPSDNLPGIPGVGEKTATKWIQQFGSLEELVNRVDEVKGKVGDALREHLGDVLRNRQMTALIRDVPLAHIGAGPDELIPRVWDREQIHQLFDTLQFRVLRERLYATLPDGICGVAAAESATAEPAAGFEVEVRSLGPDEVPEWIADHAASVAAEGQVTRAGVAVSGTWGRGTGTVSGIAIAAPDGHGAYLDPTALTEADSDAFAGWLADPDLPKALHDAKGPMHAFAAHGFELAGLTSDTALAAYLALPGQRSFDLGDLTLRYLGKELRADSETPEQLTLDGSGEEDAAANLVLHARATARAGRRAATLTWSGAAPSPCCGTWSCRWSACWPGWNGPGSPPTRDYLADMSATLHGEVKSAEQAAFAVTGHEFNLGSPKQLQEVLFDRAGPAQDQAHQDRLHDRLRRADQLAGPDRAPGA